MDGTARELIQEIAPRWARAVSRPVSLSPRVGWRILQIAADVMTAFSASAAGYGLYLLSQLGAQHLAPIAYLKLSLGIAFVTVLFLSGAGAYRNHMGVLRIEAVRLVVLAVSWAFLVFLLASFFVGQLVVSRLTVLIQLPLIVFALVSQRLGLWAIRERWSLFRRVSRPVLIYGAGDTGQVLARQLLEEHHLGLEPTGFIDDDAERHGHTVRVGRGIDGKTLPVIGGESSLIPSVRELQAAVVFLAIPSAPSARIEELVALVEEEDIPYFCVPSAGKLLLSGQKFGQVAGIPVFTRRRPSGDRLYELSKRLIDVLVAGTMLVVTSPLIAAAAVAIKLTSNGPLFFKQTRSGEGGRPFTIYKLRTMHHDSPRYARHPERHDDDRMFPVGRWLRRFSIDELPQLWNVLRGDMSLVGPRPEMPFVVERYNAIQRQRLSVKPGLSGLWQISEDRAFSIEDNMQYDLYYVENHCLSLDLAILIMTPYVVVGKYGAR